MHVLPCRRTIIDNNWLGGGGAWPPLASRRPSGLRKTTMGTNSLGRRVNWSGPGLARVGGGCRLASMAEDLPRLTPQSALKMDQWKMAATTHVSASDQFVLGPGRWLGRGLWL